MGMLILNAWIFGSITAILLYSFLLSKLADYMVDFITDRLWVAWRDRHELKMMIVATGFLIPLINIIYYLIKNLNLTIG